MIATRTQSKFFVPYGLYVVYRIHCFVYVIHDVHLHSLVIYFFFFSFRLYLLKAIGIRMAKTFVYIIVRFTGVLGNYRTLWAPVSCVSIVKIHLRMEGGVESMFSCSICFEKFTRKGTA